MKKSANNFSPALGVASTTPISPSPARTPAVTDAPSPAPKRLRRGAQRLPATRGATAWLHSSSLPRPLPNRLPRVAVSDIQAAAAARPGCLRHSGFEVGDSEMGFSYVSASSTKRVDMCLFYESFLNLRRLQLAGCHSHLSHAVGGSAG